LETTGAPNLTYIGFSQGTAQAFAGLSINPALNEKINLFIALAPATTPSGKIFRRLGHIGVVRLLNLQSRSASSCY
jgi:hypothetical protein